MDLLKATAKYQMGIITLRHLPLTTQIILAWETGLKLDLCLHPQGEADAAWLIHSLPWQHSLSLPLALEDLPLVSPVLPHPFQEWPNFQKIHRALSLAQRSVQTRDLSSQPPFTSCSGTIIFLPSLQASERGRVCSQNHLGETLSFTNSKLAPPASH
jgi:hypothetical protein